MRGESDLLLSLLLLGFDEERESLLELKNPKSDLLLAKVWTDLLGATLPEILHMC